MQSITGINSVDFNNINTEEGENLINNLPNEVLSIIFSKLDDNSIQNSSFVCKRWKSLVIYNDMMEERHTDLSIYTVALYLYMYEKDFHNENIKKYYHLQNPNMN